MVRGSCWDKLENNLLNLSSVGQFFWLSLAHHTQPGFQLKEGDWLEQKQLLSNTKLQKDTVNILAGEHCEGFAKSKLARFAQWLEGNHRELKGA